jgi:hypothetical protein
MVKAGHGRATCITHPIMLGGADRGSKATMDSAASYASTVANRDKADAEASQSRKPSESASLRASSPPAATSRRHDCGGVGQHLDWKIHTESLCRFAPRGESISACMAAPAFRFASWPFMARAEGGSMGGGRRVDGGQGLGLWLWPRWGGVEDRRWMITRQSWSCICAGPIWLPVT